MHLLFVTEELGKIPSGVVTVLAELCREWPVDDEITVLMNPGHWAEGRLLESLPGANHVRVRRVPSLLINDRLNTALAAMPRYIRICLRLALLPAGVLQSMSLLVWLATWMRGQRIEGILSHNGGWPGGALNRRVIYAGVLARVPHRILVVHNTPLVPRFPPLRWLFSAMAYLTGLAATRIVTVSRACRDSLERHAGFGQAVDVIHNGIPLDKGARRSGDGTPPWPKRGITLGFVGELHPRKGVHVLLEALSHVSVSCELVLVGNGDEVYTAELKATAEGIDHPVHFLGFRDDAADLYRWMDVVILPSLNFESFGMVLLEAMREELPVICSDFGGMKEVVADGETGFVTPAGDAHALAKAIDRLIADKTLRRKMGKAGRLRLENCFTTKDMVRRYMELFHAG